MGVDYYLGARVHKDGSFAGWFRIPCNGKCHIFKVNAPAMGVILTPS